MNTSFLNYSTIFFFSFLICFGRRSILKIHTKIILVFTGNTALLLKVAKCKIILSFAVFRFGRVRLFRWFRFARFGAGFRLVVPGFSTCQCTAIQLFPTLNHSPLSGNQEL